MLLDKNKTNKQNKPLPMLLTDDYFFFRGIININYINKQQTSHQQRSQKKRRENLKNRIEKLKKLVKLRNLSFMYDEL